MSTPISPPMPSPADDSPAPEVEPAPSLSWTSFCTRLADWARREPLAAGLAAALVFTLIYFFGFFKVFTNGALTTARWAWEAWNPENNQEHSMLILPIAFYLAWYHRDKLVAAPKAPSTRGLWIVASGVLCFVLAVRALQPRLAIVALPLLLLGSIWFLWGRPTARILLFPCAFLLFMVPIGGLVQGTVSLQILVSSVCNVLASIIGIKIEASGTTIRSLDGSFNFEIAEGCSGIRSLMAMITLTALYVHFTQDQLWKKVAIFGGSLVFAVVGNIGRIFTVILVARFISPTLAGGLYHDYSGFIFFPIAVSAMVSFSNLLNRDWSPLAKALTASDSQNDPPAAGSQAAPQAGPKSAPKPRGPISYDY